jgi:vacuolar-type H+-ATPase subunit I/STV1
MMISQERIEELIDEFAPHYGGHIYEENTNDLEPQNFQSFLTGSIEDLRSALQSLEELMEALQEEDVTK